MARNFSTGIAGEIYRGGGSLLQDEEFTPFVDAYRAQLRTAGSEVAKTGKISAETTRLLEQPLIPAPNFPDIFVTNANAYMDQMIEGKKKP